MIPPDAANGDFAHWIDDVLFPLQQTIVVSILLSLTIFLLGALGVRTARAKGAPSRLAYVVCALGIIGFFTTTLASLIANGFVLRAAEADVDRVLGGALKSLTIDRRTVSDANGLHEALRDYHAHLPPLDHAQPLARLFHLRIETTAGTADLLLRRNASHAHEYWLYDPTYKTTVVAAIGHIETSALDDRP